jgi:DNA-binding CsgD family transcriptional regulator
MGGSRVAAVGDRYVAAIEAIYAAAATPSRWPEALQSIGHCFNDVGSLFVYQRDDGSFGTVVAPALEAAQRDYQQEWWRQDVRMMRALERGYMANLDTVTERHLVTPEETETLPFYTRFLASHGLKWFAGTALSPDPRVGVALSVQRSASKPEYSDDDLALLERIGRHVENALRLGIRLINAEMARMALAEALARLGVGVFLVDRMGRVVFSNPAGQRLIGGGLVMVRDRLAARFAPEREALEVALATVIEGASVPDETPRPILVRGVAAEQFLAVYVLPVRLPGHSIDNMLAAARATVLVIASQPGAPPDPTIVRDLLGLTLGESRVAALVGAGVPPREAADKLGITEETARTTLKRVFAQVGVSRQSELATLLTRLVLR